MPSIIKLQGDNEIALTTANTVGEAKLVRIYNDQSSAVLITHTDSTGANTIGTFSVGSKNTVFVEKDYTDLVSANAEVSAVKIGFRA